NVAAGASCGSGFRVSSSNNTLEAGGGTSFDSQIFGGMLALIEQKIGHRVGNANPTLYALANTPAYYTPGATIATASNVVFNDVTTGNNSQPCSAGTVNCTAGVIGFSAGTGYDQVTGWGSVNLTNLANDWSLVTPLGVGSLGSNTSVTTLSASAGSVASGSSVTLTATVTGSAGTPTGTVQFFANGVSVSGAIALSGNTATYVWTTSCSALGQQVLSASYSGDLNYQGSKGPVLPANGGTASPVDVQVTSASCPDFSLSTATPSVSVAAGGTIPPVTITATPVNGFTGTVTFSAVVSSSSTANVPTLILSPTSVTLNSSASATTTLTLAGISAELRMPHAPAAGGVPWSLAGSGIAVASLFMLFIPRRRRLGGLLLVVVAFATVGFATGCGSSQSGPPPTVTTNTYVINVTGTYTSSSNQITQHTTTVTYSIQ
ncbi:MAG TPA: Ig-like domain repeat protein, partial [Acidobacteriaceae bacterium]|nr:Ig-like domain repeat protein [Acidobacteriaceae bacterium]